MFVDFTVENYDLFSIFTLQDSDSCLGADIFKQVLDIIKKFDTGISEINIQKKRKRNQAWTEGDSAWAVFDGDEHIEQSLDNWRNAIDRARKQNIQLAITNPCLEFWYLIHFRDHFAQITRDRVINLLVKHIPNYDKSMCLYPEPLKPLTEQAIQRAERIAAQIQWDELDEHSNPCCSGLPNLVQSLLKLENS